MEQRARRWHRTAPLEPAPNLAIPRRASTRWQRQRPRDGWVRSYAVPHAGVMSTEP